MVIELKYGNTNTYLIKGTGKYILFDTDWAGTFPRFGQALGEKGIRVQDIEYLFISHFHPDHMGIAQDLAALGVTIVVIDAQKDFIHCSDAIFAKEKNGNFTPIDDNGIMVISMQESRALLENSGIKGEILYTPGHSDDSISLWLDEGVLLVGDLNPLYELELHKDSQIGKTWDYLLKLKPKTIYYGHARPAVLDVSESKTVVNISEMNGLVSSIVKLIDKGYDISRIQRKTKADRIFIEDVMRMYLTHPGVSIQGILDRIEIKNR